MAEKINPSQNDAIQMALEKIYGKETAFILMGLRRRYQKRLSTGKTPWPPALDERQLELIKRRCSNLIIKGYHDHQLQEAPIDHEILSLIEALAEEMKDPIFKSFIPIRRSRMATDILQDWRTIYPRVTGEHDRELAASVGIVTGYQESPYQEPRSQEPRYTEPPRRNASSGWASSPVQEDNERGEKSYFALLDSYFMPSEEKREPLFFGAPEAFAQYTIANLRRAADVLAQRGISRAQFAYYLRYRFMFDLD
jgi:hypothetical protein